MLMSVQFKSSLQENAANNKHFLETFVEMQEKRFKLEAEHQEKEAQLRKEECEFRQKMLDLRQEEVGTRQKRDNLAAILQIASTLPEVMRVDFIKLHCPEFFL